MHHHAMKDIIFLAVAALLEKTIQRPKVCHSSKYSSDEHRVVSLVINSGERSSNLLRDMIIHEKLKQFTIVFSFEIPS